MGHCSVTLRGENFGLEYRVTEDDPAKYSFEVDWYFTAPPSWAKELTDAEHEIILTRLVEAVHGRAGNGGSD